MWTSWFLKLFLFPPLLCWSWALLRLVFSSYFDLHLSNQVRSIFCTQGFSLTIYTYIFFFCHAGALFEFVLCPAALTHTPETCDLQQHDGLVKHSPTCQILFIVSQTILIYIFPAIIYSGSLPPCNTEALSEGPMNDCGEFITPPWSICCIRVNYGGITVS